MKTLSKVNKVKFWDNAKKFTFPILAVFLAQLALGVPFKEAGLVALLAAYGLGADYFKKAK